jgi:RsiW-degrading membrane proteinase PrsW (M82 family)
MSITASTVLYGLAGGLLPALGWLWFFLHEDPHPEPRTKLVETFIAGMVTVSIAILLEEAVGSWIGSGMSNTTLVIWAVLEEVLKFGAAWIVALRTKFMDEPVDAIIYMLTVALGFAAIENSLFLASSLSGAAFLNTILTGSLRFIGATLVHVVSSGILGAALALSFYRSRKLQFEFAIAGLTAAGALHAGFNLLIMNTAQTQLLYIFAVVWTGVVGLMLLFERAKYIKRAH